MCRKFRKISAIKLISNTEDLEEIFGFISVRSNANKTLISMKMEIILTIL